MLNEVNVKIKLVRSKDIFCVMSQADCKVMITKAAMFVRKVKLSPSVFLAHANSLENGMAKYPCGVAFPMEWMLSLIHI